MRSCLRSRGPLKRAYPPRHRGNRGERAARRHAGESFGGGGDSEGWKRIAAVLIVAGIALAVGLWFLSRFIAETRDASFIIGGIWVVLVGAGLYAYTRSRPEIRRVALGGFAAMVVGVAVVGWWTGIRETSVNENVVVASQSATGAERDAALAGGDSGSSNTGSATNGGGGNGSNGAATGGGSDSDQQKGSKDDSKGGAGDGGGNDKQQSSGPVSLSKGNFVGVDGHDGKGKAEYVKNGNDRKVTFTDFDVDPGPNIVVWLTKSPSDLDDRIELGKLKGTQGNQQYSIPSDANLSKYDTVVLYCTPFTVRVAVAELG